MIRCAQYGTKHGHAQGKLLALQRNKEVAFAGIYEPDPDRRRELQDAEDENAYAGVHWFESPAEILENQEIVAVASEGSNRESLEQTSSLLRAGKHVWYDKPAGDDWETWRAVVAEAEARRLCVQMGYMLRYHDGFERIASWARHGVLGDIFFARAHMSTHIPEDYRRQIARDHRGGIMFDLGGHVLDQIVWLLGRPNKVTSFLRNDGVPIPGFADNTLAVFEFARAMAIIDIAALESRPTARRFEVYGSNGSAIILEPFEPGHQVRLCLEEPREGYSSGSHLLSIRGRSRQQLYELELEAFLAAVKGEQPPDRTLDHELLVQESLLRATGHLPG